MDELNQEYLTVRSAVVIPGLQSLVNGVFYGVAAGGVVAVANGMQLLDLPPLAVGAIVGSLSGLAAWRGLLQDWRVLLYGAEYEPDPEPLTVTEPVNVALYSDGGQRGQFAQLPVTEDQITQLASGVVNGDSLAVSRWCGRGGVFSRSEFERLRGEMIQLGWLEWKSERDNARGVSLTRGGAAVMRYFASDTTSPPSLRR